MAGGGTTFINIIPVLNKLKVSPEEKVGVDIIKRALEEPLRQIATNAGLEGSVVVERVKKSGKLGYGLNALTEEYCDLVKSGIVDPVKVTRSALQNASSIAALLLTTECVIADIPKPEPPMPAPGPGMDY